jgi:hypothetical protein
MFQSPHQSQEAHKKKGGWETWKSNKPKKALTYNDGAFLNKSILNFPQSYQHTLPIENMQNS